MLNVGYEQDLIIFKYNDLTSLKKEIRYLLKIKKNLLLVVVIMTILR